MAPEQIEPHVRIHAAARALKPGWSGLTRRVLGTIYSPEQIEIWTTSHASGDPVAVASKSLRLCGIDSSLGTDDLEDFRRRVGGLCARAERLGAGAPAIRAAAVGRRRHADTSADRCEFAREEVAPMGPAEPGPGSPDLRSSIQTIADARPLHETLHLLVDLTARTIERADHVGLALTAAHEVRAPVWTDPVPRILDGVHRATGQGPSLDAAASAQTVEVRDLDTDRRWPAFSDHALARTGVHSILAVPLVVDGGVLGTLNVLSDAPNAFDDRDRHAAAVFSAHGAAVMRAIRSRAEVVRLLEERDLLEEQDLPAADSDRVPSSQSLDGHAAFDELRTAAQQLGADRRSAVRPAAPSTRSETPGLVVTELHAERVALGAVRRMVASERPDEVVHGLREAIRELGGRIVEASDDERAVPVDLVNDDGEPLFVVPEPMLARAPRHLQAHVPRLVEDARRAIVRLEQRDQLLADTDVDPVTGLFSRRAYERLAHRLGPGDVLVLLDLDDLDAVIERHGPAAGDHVLRSFAGLLREQVRASEYAIRFDGEEFLVVLRDADTTDGDLFLARLRLAWAQRQPHRVDVSAGVAAVNKRVDAALEHADRQLYDHQRSNDPRPKDTP